MRITVVLLACFALAACQTTKGVPSNRCPPLVAYSPQKMKQAAAAIRQLPPDSPLHALVSDYHRTRDAIRRCDK